MTQYRLAFNGMLYETQANALRDRIIQALEQSDCESLTVLFSSEGGGTVHGLSLYNFIRNLPKPITMHATGHVGSMAIPVFLAADRRTCAPFSRFFFHAYDWGFSGRQMSDRVAEALQRLDDDIKLSCKITSERTNLPPERLAELYGRAPTPTIFTPEEAKDVGIVHDIVELNPTGAAQEGVATWSVNWSS